MNRRLSKMENVPILLAVLCAAVLWAAPASGGEAAPETRQPLVAAFHVHSTVSTGTLTLDELADRAERMGIDALILCENFSLRYEYGLPPLRGVFKRSVSLPSVARYGVGRFLKEVQEAQARHPRVLLVPGVEVAPHYFWTGSLLDRNLTMHNAQKNLLVFGLAGEEDFLFLPAIGNDHASRFDWAAAVNMLPVMLLWPALWLWQRPSRTARLHQAAALALATVAVLLSLNAWPFAEPVFSQYDSTLGDHPYQAVIDAVTSGGGLAVWSMPEARDFHVHAYGPLGSVTVRTDPYPEALARTAGYAGFGGLYQDTRTATEPGGLWDRLLSDHLAGQRPVPPFAYGEIAFHTPGEAGIELNQVLNVLRVRERSVAGVLEAMRTGRVYAVAEPTPPLGLRLDRFEVGEDGGERGGQSGEIFVRKGHGGVTIRVAVSTADAKAHTVELSLIRSGQTIARITGETPFTQRFMDRTLPAGERAFYRVEVHGEGGREILSNPIFLREG
jgi:hypothetical protein